MNEPAKPIEKGCLCRVISPESVFFMQECTAIRRSEHGERSSLGGSLDAHWHTDITWRGYGISFPEDRLMRIDDPDLQKQIENEQEKVCG